MRWLFLIAASAAPLFSQLATPNSSGVSMGHIHLIVKDPDGQKKLWTDLVGAEVVKINYLELLKLPGVFILVGKARTESLEGSEGSTTNHFGFLVKNYSETKAKLTAANLSFVSDNPGTKALIVEFPEKVRVEFTEDATLTVPVVFNHVHMASTNPDALRAWYIKIFGATEAKRDHSPAAVVPGGEVDFLKITMPATPTKGRTLDHIGFEVKGLEAFCKKLQADGMSFDGAFRESPQLDGLKTAYIIDPDGTRIELTEGFAAR